jgi:hypothetical protein
MVLGSSKVVTPLMFSQTLFLGSLAIFNRLHISCLLDAQLKPCRYPRTSYLRHVQLQQESLAIPHHHRNRDVLAAVCISSLWSYRANEVSQWSITGDTLSLATPTFGCEAATSKERLVASSRHWVGCSAHVDLNFPAAPSVGPLSMELGASDSELRVALKHGRRMEGTVRAVFPAIPHPTDQPRSFPGSSAMWWSSCSQ